MRCAVAVRYNNNNKCPGGYNHDPSSSLPSGYFQQWMVMIVELALRRRVESSGSSGLVNLERNVFH